MTHRQLSRNGLSSRAEPLSGAIRRAREDPVEPLVWMYDARRMQHGILMSDDDRIESIRAWNDARDGAIRSCQKFLDLGLHRQYALRVLEPFLRIRMVISATSVNNLFALRIHKAPMPEIQQLVVGMARAYRASTPRRLKAGEWHLPYVIEMERSAYPGDVLARVSTSRAARASYPTLEGKIPDIESDFRLHDQLMGADPKHASPAEHPAMATGDRNVRSGNFRGWIQYRHTVLGESAPDVGFDLDARLTEYDGVDYII